MADSSYCYRKNEQILYKELHDGPVLLDPYRRVMIPLNPVALEIWRLADGGHSVAEITAALRDVFDIGEEEAERDAASFLNELAKREMVR